MGFFRKIWAVAAILLFAFFQYAHTQTWQQTGVTNGGFNCIASSADGTKLAASGFIMPAGGSLPAVEAIYTSTNAGATWTMSGAPTNVYWYSIASSADGTKLAAYWSYGPEPEDGGYISTSTNSGATWKQPGILGGTYSCIASSADGAKLATVNGGGICTSTNSGLTWVYTNAPNVPWTSIASSADGTKLAAAYAGSESGIYISTNSGVTWTLTGAPTNLYWESIASSADGTKLAVVGEVIWTSTNSGSAWTQTSAPTNMWHSIVLSADGTKLAAYYWTNGINGSTTGGSYISTNSGRTWTLTSGSGFAFTAIASSVDGAQLIAAFSYQFSTESPEIDGVSTYNMVTAPSLNLAPGNGSVNLSWIVPSTNFVLQQCCDLCSWSNVTNVPDLNLANLQYQVALPMTNSCGFYRLATP